MFWGSMDCLTKVSLTEVFRTFLLSPIDHGGEGIESVYRTIDI